MRRSAIFVAVIGLLVRARCSSGDTSTVPRCGTER